MNHHVQNKVKMYKAVIGTCTANASDWNSLAAFGTAFDKLKPKVTEVENIALEQAARLGGVKAHKNKRKGEIMENVIVVASSLIAYAKATDDELLKGKLKFSPSTLKNGSEPKAMQFMDLVLQKAQEQLPNLAAYSVTQQVIDDLLTEREELGELLGSVRAAIIERREFTTAIRNLVKEIDGILRYELDKLAVVLKAGNPKFYGRYKAARDITDHKGKSVKPLGNLPDGINLPLPPHNPGTLIPPAGD